MTDYNEIWYQSADGLRLFARDYAANTTDAPRGTLLLMHGLTRNSADFEPLVRYLQPAYRCIVVDQRGRGRSDYDSNSTNYTPQVYAQDMLTLLAHLNIDCVTTIGTSMGGLISMAMAALQPNAIQAMVLNDIGPEVPPEAINRLKQYVGKMTPVGNWDEAAHQAKSINAVAFPNATDAFWVDFAKRTYLANADGVPVLAYDPRIQEAFEDDYDDRPTDLWPLFDLVCKRPLLVIRGAISDLLTPDCVNEMRRRQPDMSYMEVPGVGHAPILDEPTAVHAILDFLNLHANQTP